MTTSRQKDMELAQLERALNLGGINDYSILDKDGESPDFLIDIAGERVGIEVTSIYRDLNGETSAKAESDLPFITEEAVKAYNAQGGVPLVFGFAYDGKVAVPSRKHAAKMLGAFLYDYTARNFPNGIKEIQTITVKREENDSLAFVNFVGAQPTDHEQAVGFIVSAFNAVEVADAMVEEAIRNKEKLLSKYLQRCDKVWLLIVLPTMNLAADLRMPANRNIKFTHAFDCVYLLDDYRNQLMKVSNA